MPKSECRNKALPEHSFGNLLAWSGNAGADPPMSGDGTQRIRLNDADAATYRLNEMSGAQE
jgi:hypothetical protein